MQTPLSRIFIFLGGVLLLVILPTDKLNLLPIRSVYETVFDITPYSSGITRGLSKILHGDFVGAYEVNKLSYVVLATIVFLIVKDVYALVNKNQELI